MRAIIEKLIKGVLIVYNLDQPVEIPFKKLFGKWKKSYIGIALTFKNNAWEIDGEPVKTVIIYPSPFFTTVQRLILKYKSLYLLGKLRIER